MNIIKRLFTEKNISFLAACITLATAIIGVLAVDAARNVFNGDLIGSNGGDVNVAKDNAIIMEVTNYYTKDKSVAEELQNAQNAYAAGEYSYAVEIYKKYKDINPVAALNLGYLTSNGLGVQQSYDQAGQHYLNAYNMKLSKGLDNYLFIKLCKPNSLEDTLNALLYGISEGNEKAIMYAVYLQTDKLYTNAELIRDQASQFVDLNHQQQLDLLANKITDTDVYVESFAFENIPTNTDYKEYTDMDRSFTHRFVADKLTELTKINGQWIEVENPVYSFEVRNLFLVKCKGFNFAEQTFAETFFAVN